MSTNFDVFKVGEVSNVVSEKDKKETERLLPYRYDYRTLSSMRRSFQRWHSLESLDEKGGDAMGKMLMENTSKLFDVKERSEKNRREKFEWFFSEFQSMKVLKTECPWFESLMEAIIVDSKETRKKSKSNNNDDFDKLALLNRSDGYTLGSRFLEELNGAATEIGAFYSFVNKYPALIEFNENHKFFKSLLVSIGKEMKHRATWNKLVRSIGAAGMSQADVGSDVYTIWYVGRASEP